MHRLIECAKRIRNDGPEEAGNVRPWLDQPDDMLLVEEGTADVFLVPVEGGEIVGARQFVARIERGQLAMGVTGFEQAQSWALLVSDRPDTQRVRVDREALREACGGTGDAEEFTHAVSHWLERLAGAAQGMSAVELPDTGPLGEARPSLRVGLWDAVDGHARAVLSQLVEERLAERQAFEASLHDRRDGDAQSLKSALFQLATPVNHVAPEVAVEASQDPVLAACRAIGPETGIGFSSPAETTPEGDPDHRLAEIARASKVRYRKVALKGEWWRRDNGPMVGFKGDERQPVALVHEGAVKGYRVIDPIEQRSYKLLASSAEAIEPFAYCFYRAFSAVPLSLTRLMSFTAQGRRYDVGMIVLLALLVGLMGLATPWATGLLVDEVIPNADSGQLWELTAALIAIALASAGFGLTQSFTQLRVEGKADAAVQSAVWDRLLKLPATFFRGYTAGDLSSRANGITAIRKELSGTTLNSVMTSLFSLVTLALMFYYSARLAFIALGVALVAMLLSGILGVMTLKRERRIAELEGQISGIVYQLLSGVGKLRAAAAETRAFACWAKPFQQKMRQSVRAEYMRTVVSVVADVFPLVGAIVIFAAMAFVADRQQLSTGEFLAFNAAFGTFLGSAVSLTDTLIGLLGIVPLYERAKPILESVPEIDDTKAHPGVLSGRIAVSDLSFGYGDEASLVLKGIDLDIKPGEFVAIVGASGSGKSTLLRLLLGFEYPRTGTVSYDFQDLATLDLGAVRRQMGVVLQNGQLMDGDIFSNIIGTHPLGLEAAEEAARRSGLDHDIADMPMGMHTMVGEGSSALSGGQRQRLLIARAIVHQPNILFLDEATSALDNRSQATVSASLEALETTRVVIAHRLSTVLQADRIIVLDQGQIVETGTYQELMEQGGLFHQMAQRQVA